MSDASTNSRNTNRNGVWYPQDLLTPNQAGAKAFSLKRMLDLGLNVPPFLVLAPELCVQLHQNRELTEEVSRELYLGCKFKSYAIRPSALIEDGVQSSFAGQFQTVVEVDEKSLPHAIEQVLNQAHEFLQGDLSRFSIIVQKYIYPEISGVTFTRNPLGSREMVIETHRGRGEDLVSGRVRPSRFSVHRHGRNVPTDVVIPLFEMLVRVFETLELDLEFPQDIEWCIGKDGFYLLQSRPITTLRPEQVAGFRYLDQHLPQSSRFIFEKTEISEVAPHPSPVTMGILDKIYANQGPCANVYRKHGIKYRGRDMMRLIGNQLYIDSEQELKTLFPNLTLFKDSGAKPRWTWSSGMFVTIRNSLAFGWLFSRANEGSLAVLEEAIRTKAAASPSPEFKERLDCFLKDYETIFEVNLLAAAAAKRIEYLLAKQPITPASLSRARSIFLDPREMQPLVISLPLRGNCLDIADESEYANHRANADASIRDSQVEQWWADRGKMKQAGIKAPLVAWLRLEHLRELARTLTVVHVNRLRDSVLKNAEKYGFQDLRSIYFAHLPEILESKVSEQECLRNKEKFFSLEHLTFEPRLSDQFEEKKSDWQSVSIGTAEGLLVSWQQYKNEIAVAVRGTEKYVIYTDSLFPEIAPHFGNVVGVLSRTGGLLSHLAIVARERGIPVITRFVLPENLKMGDRVLLCADPLNGKSELTEKKDFNMRSPEDALASELKHRFESTLSTLTSKSVEKLYQDIAAKYSEIHRRYHNLTHIQECLAALQTVNLPDDDRIAIELAIWFHDVIYDPKSKTNEEDSAQYFLATATELGLDDNLRTRVAAYIEATKRHETSTPSDLALGYFLDIDLAILGADEQRFAAYDAAIRAEFSWVPGIIYKPKRKKILRGFLERENLFLTPEFRARYEDKARQNLTKLI